MTAHPISRIAHDTQAFESFYRANVVAVQRFVVRRVNDPHLAADLTADVFLAAIDSASAYDDRRGSPQAWLYGVARNVVNAELRRRTREQRAVRRFEGRRLLDQDDIERLQQRIDAAREARLLYAAIADLPDGERAVLELVALDELTVTQTAAALDISAVTARVRLHRARTALRQVTPPPAPSPVTTSTEAS